MSSHSSDPGKPDLKKYLHAGFAELARRSYKIMRLPLCLALSHILMVLYGRYFNANILRLTIQYGEAVGYFTVLLILAGMIEEFILKEAGA